MRTHELLASLPKIAAFAGVPTDSLLSERGWEFRTERKHRILAMLDVGYVRETAERHSGEMMERLFGDITWGWA
jgi:hypothetical protein